MANKLQESHGNDETQETLSSMKETERKRIEEEEIDLKALMQRLKLQKPGDGVGFGSSVKRNLITMPSSGKTPQAKRMATQRQSLFSVSSQHQAASLIPTSTRRDQKTQQNTPERRNSHNLQQTGASLLKAKTPSKKISMTPYQSNSVSLAPSNNGAGGAAVALSNGSGSGKHGAVTTQKSEGFTAAAHQHHLIRFPTSTISSGGSHLEKTQSAIGGPRLSKK
ncbi:hypothetical protein FGO68_gene14542 [Halteria grandinella]|uniref:Uncharacterized protein n=1 Tax=Halteria grandinella TaxID=5974 RepID=A0A8J8T8D6_HALGN|nr:hypothetical protein FGO68_gene14542 [Halteria grandinella]